MRVSDGSVQRPVPQPFIPSGTPLVTFIGVLVSIIILHQSLNPTLHRHINNGHRSYSKIHIY